MSRRIDISSKLNDSKDLARFTVKRYNEDRHEDLFLFNKNKDLKYYDLIMENKNPYIKKVLWTMENYIKDNLSKLRVTAREFCERVYPDKEDGWFKGWMEYDKFKEIARDWYTERDIPIGKKLTKRQEFSVLMEMTSPAYKMDEVTGMMSKKEYFFYIYSLYLKCGGQLRYIGYTVDRSNEKQIIYSVLEDPTVDIDAGLVRYGVVVDDEVSAINTINAITSINKQEVFIVIDNTENSSSILFGKDELCNYLCIEKNVGLKNFQYYWFTMGHNSSEENKMGKRFIIGNYYVNQFNLREYKYLGYTDEGKLLFGSHQNAILFTADDMFDEIEYRVYNLEENMKKMKEKISEITTDIKEYKDHMKYVIECIYVNTQPSEERSRQLLILKDQEEGKSMHIPDGTKIGDNLIVFNNRIEKYKPSTATAGPYHGYWSHQESLYFGPDVRFPSTAEILSR